MIKNAFKIRSWCTDNKCFSIYQGIYDKSFAHNILFFVDPSRMTATNKIIIFNNNNINYYIERYHKQSSRFICIKNVHSSRGRICIGNTDGWTILTSDSLETYRKNAIVMLHNLTILTILYYGFDPNVPNCS